MKVKKSTLYTVGTLVLVIVAGLFMLNAGEANVTGNVVATGGVASEGDVQKVTLSMKGGNYYPREVRVKAGQPVEISLDDSVYGCFRDFTVPDFGIHEYLQSEGDVVTFTPTEPGRYMFACSMRMGTGTLVVE